MKAEEMKADFQRAETLEELKKLIPYLEKSGTKESLS